MDNIKNKLLEALEKCNGIVTSACKSIDCPRSTYYNYYNTDPEFKAAVNEIQDVAIDFVESKLMEKINGISTVVYSAKGEEQVYEQPPSDTAIIFFLKTKGKKRGYQEVVVNKNVNFNSDIETEKLKDIANKLDGDY